jgi:hypothetical protein
MAKSWYGWLVKGISYQWSCALLLALSCTWAPAQIAPEFQEQGVLYLEGNLPSNVTATFKVATTVYLHRDFQMVIASFGPGQEAELIGMSPEGYLLKGTYRNNTIIGWIHPEDLPTGIDPSIFETAKKNQAHHDAVAVAIANKSVIQGMTPDEVKQSVGRPEQVSSRTDPSGSMLTWTFTTYREEPQYNYALNAFGRAVLQTYYVKIPIGQLIVSFVNGAVTSVEEHKTDPNSPGVVTN